METKQRDTARNGAASDGRLTARPHPPRNRGDLGLHPLNLDSRCDTWVYVPAGYDPGRPAPLVVALHGAGGEGRNHLRHLRSQADEHGLILLAPSSSGQTWDVLHGGYGPDIELINTALEETFDRYLVDEQVIAVEGFSDGASYALSIGLTNGDLFGAILAFSPGFMAPTAQRGAPRIFLSHGTQDRVLPIDVCSRRLVPRLERAGYDVRAIEFTGGHTVPDDIARYAVEWFIEVSEPASNQTQR